MFFGHQSHCNGGIWWVLKGIQREENSITKEPACSKKPKSAKASCVCVCTLVYLRVCAQPGLNVHVLSLLSFDPTPSPLHSAGSLGAGTFSASKRGMHQVPTDGLREIEFQGSGSYLSSAKVQCLMILEPTKLPCPIVGLPGFQAEQTSGALTESDLKVPVALANQNCRGQPPPLSHVTVLRHPPHHERNLRLGLLRWWTPPFWLIFKGRPKGTTHFKFPCFEKHPTLLSGKLVENRVFLGVLYLKAGKVLTKQRAESYCNVVLPETQRGQMPRSRSPSIKQQNNTSYYNKPIYYKTTTAAAANKQPQRGGKHSPPPTEHRPRPA